MWKEALIGTAPEHQHKIEAILDVHLALYGELGHKIHRVPLTIQLENILDLRPAAVPDSMRSDVLAAMRAALKGKDVPVTDAFYDIMAVQYGQDVPPWSPLTLHTYAAVKWPMYVETLSIMALYTWDAKLTAAQARNPETRL